MRPRVSLKSFSFTSAKAVGPEFGVPLGAHWQMPRATETWAHDVDVDRCRKRLASTNGAVPRLTPCLRQTHWRWPHGERRWMIGLASANVKSDCAAMSAKIAAMGDSVCSSTALAAWSSVPPAARHIQAMAMSSGWTGPPAASGVGDIPEDYESDQGHATCIGVTKRAPCAACVRVPWGRSSVIGQDRREYQCIRPANSSSMAGPGQPHLLR